MIYGINICLLGQMYTSLVRIERGHQQIESYEREILWIHYLRNRRGTITESWGTPEATGIGLEIAPPTTTC